MRRLEQKDEIGVRYGFYAWLRLHEVMQGSAKTKTYDDFSHSRVYNAFVKFGRHQHSIRAINPKAFTEWMIQSKKNIDHWCKDEYYKEYLKSYLRKEAAQDALERSITEMQIWADENKSLFNHFFRYAATNRICSMLANGRISPWVLYCSDTGNEALSKFNEEQLAIAWEWIDPDFWQKRLHDYATDTEFCRHIIKEAGF